MYKGVLVALICFFIQLNVWAGQSVDSLLSLIDTNKIDNYQASLYYDLSFLHVNTDYKKSVMYAQKGRLIADKLENDTLIAKGLLYEGIGYTNLGLFRPAYDKLSKSLHLYYKIQDTLHIISCIKNIGNFYWYEKNNKEALSYFKKADSLIKLSVYKDNEIAIYTNLGIVYTSLKKYDSALYYFTKSKKLIEKDKKTTGFMLGMVYLNIGGFYENINPDSAIYYYNKSLQFKNHFQSRVTSFVYSSMAKVYISQHKLKSAQTLLDSAKTYAKHNGNLLALREYYMVRFRYDTCSNNSKQAIKAHVNYKAIEDSIHKQSHLEKIETNKAFYELHKQEDEINQLKFENEFYKIKAKKNQYIILLLIIIGGLSILLLFIYQKLHNENKKIIKNLNTKNEDLINHKEELSTLNEEILVQREELYQKNRELQKTIQQLHDAQVQIIQSEKLASIGLLATGVAHEINNPLNFINAGLQQITDLYQENNLPDNQKETLRKSAQFIKDGILRVAKITKALGAINQPSKSEKSNVNINNIIKNILNLISFKNTTDIEFIENYGELSNFLSYPDKIQSIIIHLITNAIEAVEAHLSVPVKFIKISTWSVNEYDNEKICVLIENSGDHLSKVALHKIFDPFYTTKENKYGVGLGLYVVHKLIKELEGTIKADNTDIGISFKIEIPTFREKVN